MNATMTIDTQSFNRQLAALQRANGKASGSCVRFWSRKGIKKIAWETRKATGRFKNKGRFRAGWWPAAQALGVSTVYAGGYPNKGEGYAIDKTAAGSLSPSFTMANTVPYGPYVKGTLAAIQTAMARLEAEAKAEFDSLMKKELKTAGAGNWF